MLTALHLCFVTGLVVRTPVVSLPIASPLGRILIATLLRTLMRMLSALHLLLVTRLVVLA
ncbi:MAG: hypothetical protein ABSE96_02370 [Terracidiphilus sp.]|jgi:hypothetical protein